MYNEAKEGTIGITFGIFIFLAGLYTDVTVTEGHSLFTSWNTNRAVFDPHPSAISNPSSF